MLSCTICQTILSGRKKLFCSKKCKGKSTNNKHQTYNRQKQKGLKRKLECIEIKGGKCSSCNYDKNLAALEFHHLNPSEKDGQMDLRALSNHSNEWILKELDKCIILCSNCHRETHHPTLSDWNK